MLRLTFHSVMTINYDLSPSEASDIYILFKKIIFRIKLIEILIGGIDQCIYHIQIFLDDVYPLVIKDAEIVVYNLI